MCPDHGTWITTGVAFLFTVLYLLAHRYLHKYIYFLSWAPVRILVLGVMWSLSEGESANTAFYVSYVSLATSSLFLILCRLTPINNCTILFNTLLSLFPTGMVIYLFLNDQRHSAEITSFAITIITGGLLMYSEIDKMRPPSEEAHNINVAYLLTIILLGTGATFLSATLECMDYGIWAGLVASMPLHNTMALLFLVERDSVQEVIHVWSCGEVIHIVNFSFLVILAYLNVEVEDLTVFRDMQKWHKLLIVVSVITVCTPVLMYILHFLFLNSVKLPQRAARVLARIVPDTPPTLSDRRSGVSDTPRSQYTLRL